MLLRITLHKIVRATDQTILLYIESFDRSNSVLGVYVSREPVREQVNRSLMCIAFVSLVWWDSMYFEL